MFILRDLLTPLQQQFSTTTQGQRRAVWFVYTLLAVVVPTLPIRLAQADTLGYDPTHVRLPSDSVGVSAPFP